MANVGDDRIASATLLTTQVDFEFAGDLKVLFDRDRIGGIEAEMERAGYLDGSKMANAFNVIRSNDLIWPYVVNNYMKGKEPFPFDLLYWNADATRMPKANHSFYLRSFYLDNQLSKGAMTLAGEKIELKKVTVPIYSLATREDHIAPAKSVFHGAACFGGPVRFVVSGSAISPA
jgi:polyhydroxyalkanoate synthase